MISKKYAKGTKLRAAKKEPSIASILEPTN